MKRYLLIIMLLAVSLNLFAVDTLTTKSRKDFNSVFVGTSFDFGERFQDLIQKVNTMDSSFGIVDDTVSTDIVFSDSAYFESYTEAKELSLGSQSITIDEFYITQLIWSGSTESEKVYVPGATSESGYYNIWFTDISDTSSWKDELTKKPKLLFPAEDTLEIFINPADTSKATGQILTVQRLLKVTL